MFFNLLEIYGTPFVSDARLECTLRSGRPAILKLSVMGNHCLQMLRFSAIDSETRDEACRCLVGG